MLNRLILIASLLVLMTGLFSAEPEWGIRYGAGISTIYGENMNYTLQYDFTRVLLNQQADRDLYLRVRSGQQRADFAQSAGLFFAIPIASEINTLFLQPELIWQNYSYRYRFREVSVESNDLSLSSIHPAPVDGYIKATMDYVTVPFLLKLQQGYPRLMDENRSIFTMYGYAGPSISFLISNDTEQMEGIDDLNTTIVNFSANSMTDADTTMYYTYARRKTAADEVVALKYGLVLGFGWNFTDVLKTGLGKDEWTLDVRFDIGLNPLGDTDYSKNFKLCGILGSIGYKF